MSAIDSTPIDAEAKNAPTSGRLFFLDLGAGRILSANPDGSDLKTIINEGRKLPDGLALNVAAGHIYWTNMGDPKRNDGSIMRSDFNGKNMITARRVCCLLYAASGSAGAWVEAPVGRRLGGPQLHR